MKAQRHKVKRKRGKFKSLLEVDVDKALVNLGLNFQYEAETLPYLVPTEKHKYTPDFTSKEIPNVVIEAKGRLTIADRKKMLLIKEQYPEKTFYLVFGNANQKLYKGSPTSYAKWASKHGFKYCSFYKEGIPKEWFK